MKIHTKIRKELMRRADNDRRAAKMWMAYISFLESCPALPEHTSGTAVHHILWRVEYPRFVRSKWNLIRLWHEDHAAAAALALAAEPDNAGLRTGFTATYKAAGSSRSWYPKKSDELVHLYTNKKWSLKRIGKRYRVGPDAVRGFLVRRGVSIRTTAEALRGHKRSKKALDAQRKSLAKPEVRERMRLAHLGHKWTKGTRKKMKDALIWKPKRPNDVIRLHVDKGWTIRRLASKYHVHERTVSRFLHRTLGWVRSTGENQVGNQYSLGSPRKKSALVWRARQRKQRAA